MKNSFKNIRIPPLLMFMIFILVSKGGNGQTVTGFSGAASFEQNILYWDKFTASTPIGYEIYWQTSPGVTLSSNMIPSNGINVSLVHTGLTPGVTYYYAIRVVMAGPQYSLLSNEIAVTPLSPNNLFAGGVGDGHNAHLTCNMDMNGNVISVAPTGLSAAPAPGSNYIYWNFVPGATSYTLQWATDINFTTGVVTQTGITNISYMHSPVVPGTTYYYRVMPVLPGGCPSSYSTPVSATAVAEAYIAGGGLGDGHASQRTCTIDLNGNSIILSVANFKVAASQSSSVLYWNSLPEASSYQIEIDSITGNFSAPRIVSGITNISWVHYKAVSGLTYYYRVIPVVSGGCFTGYSNIVAVTPVNQNYITGASGDGHAQYLSCSIDLNGNSAAPAPTGLNVAASHSKNVLYWDPLSGVSSYIIRWSNDPNFNTYTDITGITNVNYVHTNLSPGTTYYYQVTATLIGGCPSGFTNIFAATPIPEDYLIGGSNDGHSANLSCNIYLDGNSAAPAPTGLNVAASYSKNVIYWQPLAGASSYIIRWSNDPNFNTYTDITGITNISYVHTGLTPGLTYYYKITAALPGGCPAGITNAVAATPVSETHIAGANGDGHAVFETCMSSLDGNIIVVSATNFQVAASLDANVMYWDYVPDVTSFTIRWSNDPNFNTYNDITGITNISYVHAPVTGGITYYYMVAPVFAGSCPSGFSSPVSVVPVYADYLKGSSGDGHSMSASCFTMTLNGFDPTITPQSPLYICPGNPVTLTSSPAASYQWYYNGNILSGEVNQNLTVNLPGYYTVKITNINNCYAWSFPATVLSGTTPVFTLNPQDTYVCPGDNANFLVVVSGATTYQWQESNDGGLNWYNLIDNSTYSGTQTDYLQIMNVTFSMNNYLYRCVVTAGCSGISSVATLSVGSPPVITKHPIDTTVCPGAPVSFTVLSSTYNTTYQWYENQGSGWVMLSNTGVYNDVTTNTLTISNTTGMNGYQYMCVLTTCSYIVNSNIATLSQYPYNTWLGFTSDWNISNNWTCGIPSPSSDVIIPSSPMGNYFPMIFSNNVATCRDIIISPGANLTINTGADLTVYGDWDNGGLPNIGLGKIIFAGTSQVVKGTNNFNNITINNGSTVTLMSSGQALAGILLCNGVLNTNDYLTLLSNASGTALISGSSIGLVNGSVVQQRFIPAAKAKGYKHFSSAFSNAHIGQFSNFMTLYLGNTNSNPYPTIFKFSEADANPLFANGWIEAAPQGATNTIIPPGIGYTAQIGNNNNDITAYLYGEVNNGNIPVNVTRINPGPGKGDGWNLVGNPYPSPIDLDKLPYINSNLNRSVSIFISTSMYNGYYGYYNAVLHYALNGGTRYLSALHSFFVQCNNTAGGTLIFNNSMRSDMVNTQLYKNEIKPPYPHIKLKAMCSQTAYLSDETAIFLIPEATENFDPDYDVAKIMNTEPDMPNIFSLSKDNYLAINSLPFDLKKEIIIPIGYSTNKSGLNFIEATEISNIDNDIEIVLEDIAKNYSQNLKEKPLYTFDYIQGEASLGRLFLRIRPSDNASNNVTNINEPYNNTIFYVYSSDKTIFISYSDFYERKGKIELFDFNGKLVKKPQELSNGTHKLVCNDLPVGNYILKFVSEGLTKITKIFIE